MSSVRLSLFAVLALGACAPGASPSETPAAPGVDDPPAGEREASAWSDELSALDDQVALFAGRFEATGSWLDAEMAAASLRQRARLSGDLDDYEAAEGMLDAGFAVAPEGSGPLLTRAGLHLTLHRILPAQDDLDAVEAQAHHSAGTLDAVADQRATLALQVGQLDAAEERWRVTEERAPSPTSAATLGRIAWLRGDFTVADAWYVAALDRYHGVWSEPVAWVHLQRGLIDLDQGDSASALQHYRASDRALGGYWLVEEHIAEALLGVGETDAALELYTDVVARTGKPELQGALGELLLELGDEEAGMAQIAAASEGFDAYLDRYPEAASGHALAHMLAWGDPAEALALAERNAAGRPDGEALTLLSEARLANGDRPGAHGAALDGLATGTRSAGLFLAAAASAPGADARDWYLAAAQDIDPSASLE